jgi:MFS family permease
MVAALMNALVGAAVVVHYSTGVFAMAGIGGPGRAEIASWTVGLVNALATVAAIGLIERYGRRPLLSVGLTGIITALLTAGYGLLAPVSQFTGGITVAALLALMVCHAFSAGPIAWLLVAEVLPARIRSRGGAAAAGLNWSANLVVALLFPILVGRPAIPGRVGIGFVVFALLSMGFLVFFRLFVPETKGLTLSEVEARLSGPGGDRLAAADQPKVTA